MIYARVTQAAPQGGSWAYSPARQAKCGGKRDTKGRVAGEHERERADIRSNEELQAAWHCVCHGVGRVLRTLHNVSHAGTDAGHMAAMARGVRLGGARSTVALHRDICHGRTRGWFKRPVQRSMVACRMCKKRPDGRPRQNRRDQTGMGHDGECRDWRTIRRDLLCRGDQRRHASGKSRRHRAYRSPQCDGGSHTWPRHVQATA